MSNDLSSSSANRKSNPLRNSANHPRYRKEEDLLADEEDGMADLSLHRIVNDRAAAANEEIAGSGGICRTQTDNTIPNMSDDEIKRAEKERSFGRSVTSENISHDEGTNRPFGRSHTTGHANVSSSSAKTPAAPQKPTQTDEEIKQAIKEGRLGRTQTTGDAQPSRAAAAPPLGRTQTSGDAPASQPAHAAKEALSVVDRDERTKQEEGANLVRDVVARRSQAASEAVSAAERDILATPRQGNERDAMVAANMVMDEKSDKADAVRENVPPSAAVRLNPDGTPVKSKLAPGGARPGAYAGGPGTGYGRVRSARLDTLGQAVEYSSSEEDSSDDEDGSGEESGRQAPMNASDRHVVGDHPVPVMQATADEEAPPAPCAPVEVAPDSDENNGSGFQKMVQKYKTILLAGGVVLVLVIVVAIVVPVVVSGGGEEAKESAGGVDTAPTMPPNVNVDPTLIPGVDESTWQAMSDIKSPQYKAYSWLIEDPNLDQYEDWRLRQRFALATFYHAMGGARWELPNFLSYEVNECQWMYREGSKVCTDDGNIQLLSVVKQRGFKGTLPPELSLLTKLQGMDFSDNVIGGNLSGLFGNNFDRPVLEIFWCNTCRLGGSIPSEFAQLTRMAALYLKENELTGEIPSELGQMVSLRFLELDRCKLSGPIPTTIGNLAFLKALQLWDNQFTSMPSEVGKLATLEELHLSKNPIEQQLPSEIGAMSQLRRVQLDGTRLYGTIPFEFVRLANLERLLLNKNNLSGGIPSELGLLNKLNWLWLSENKLEGPIPTEFGQLASVLHTLDLGRNALTSTIPSELGLLVLLQQLGLYDNSLSGTLPSEIASIPTLNKILVDGNPDLVQELPEEFCSKSQTTIKSDWCTGISSSCCARRY